MHLVPDYIMIRYLSPAQNLTKFLCTDVDNENLQRTGGSDVGSKAKSSSNSISASILSTIKVYVSWGTSAGNNDSAACARACENASQDTGYEMVSQFLHLP